MDFPRSRAPIRSLPLIPMIDVVFILIVFFMLTTSFMKVESMELLLPSSGTPQKAGANFAHILLSNDGGISFGKRSVTQAELADTLKTLFSVNPDQRIVILAADQVTLQSMVAMMDMVYVSGGKSVYIKAWNQKPEAGSPNPAPPVPDAPAAGF